MTRDRVPEFDLYAELEVSPSASAATIEAAYRSLVKVHHPDVAPNGHGRAGGGAIDGDRIKRLNLAREWLTDPARRRRYDIATGTPRTDASGVTRSAPPSEMAPERAHFGVNADAVRQYLSELRSIDAHRAAEVRHSLVIAEAAGRAEARRSAFAASKTRRLSDWLYAREAAAIIARGRLETVGDRAVVEALADAAGAIAVRDLLPPVTFELLVRPWTLRGQAGLPRPTPASQWPSAANLRPTAPPPAPPAPSNGPTTTTATPASLTRHRMPALVGLSASLVILVVILGATTLAGMLGGPGQSPAAASFGGAVAGVVNPTPTSAVGPSLAPPTPSPIASGLDPALVASLRDGAARTIARLASAASAGNVRAAQALLGSTAPGLRASGLVRATFPTVPADSIAITGSSGAWVAKAGTDRLTSGDGVHWTFDYGSRPLAFYGRTTAHTMYFLDAHGRHTISVRVTSTMVTRTYVAVALSWSFPTATDATAYRTDRITVSWLAFGSVVTASDGSPSASLAGSSLTATINVPVSVTPTSRGQVDVTVVNPNAALTGGRPFTTIDTIFPLVEA